MYFSKYTLMFPFVPLSQKQDGEAESYVVMNPLTGSFDVASLEEATKLEALKKDEWEPAGDTDREFLDYLLSRGYVFENKEAEDDLIASKYIEFQGALLESQPQVLLVPTYGCNLACTYCFQGGVDAKNGIMTKEVADAFFDHLNRRFEGQTMRPFITLFGGEPLMNSPRQREIIEYIVHRASREDYQLAAVTNGYDLEEFVPVLSRASIKEIQVTVDGPREVHDSRRVTARGTGSFDRVVRGITAAIDAGLPINLRAVVDKENIHALVGLAELADSKGWLDLGKERFKTQIGRNYELFECYAKPEHLLGQAELWAAVAQLAAENPVVKKFHSPEFKGIKHLVETGEMYLVSFDTCPAAKVEWVYDFKGDIYGCTASCGRPGYRLGTFYPEETWDREQVDVWVRRDVLNIPQCKDCDVSLICGGGCGVVAREKNGSVLSPDCRPIKQLLATGVSFYRDEIMAMAGDHANQNGER